MYSAVKKYFALFHLLLSQVIIGHTFLTTVDTFKVNLDNIYSLSSVSIVPTSENLKIGNRKLSAGEYKLNISDNSFSLSDTLCKISAVHFIWRVTINDIIS